MFSTFASYSDLTKYIVDERSSDVEDHFDGDMDWGQ
jgi:hypothetical protein